ncbi:hypothetical protein MMC18_000698 [Xylographa bjoerkii]|nr:hypothetical protein [Xylographa bjoerkii]
MTTLKGPGAPLRFDGTPTNPNPHPHLPNPSSFPLTSPGTPLRIAIVHARWNTPIITALVSGCTSTLLSLGVSAANIVTESVPGSYELPFAVQSIQKGRDSFDAVVAIGVLIKGETMHFEYIAEAVTQGLMRVQLDSGVPVVFGLLTVLTEEQALVRAGVQGGGHNHGEDWAAAAVELGVKRRGWREGRVG